MSQPFAVVLPAAGSGNRFGGGDKLLIELYKDSGVTVLKRTTEVFALRADVTHVVIVTGSDRFDAYLEALGNEPWASKVCFVQGGRERWESVLFGLRHLASQPGVPVFVAIHDAARPLVTEAVINAAFSGAVKVGGSVPCVGEPATLKRKHADGTVSETVERKGLFQAQTPQCFELGKLLAGYETLLSVGKIADVTDDAQVFERSRLPVLITEGSTENMKITTAADAVVARAILSARGV